jgi:hypothetical protein
MGRVDFGQIVHALYARGEEPCIAQRREHLLPRGKDRDFAGDFHVGAATREELAVPLALGANLSIFLARESGPSSTPQQSRKAKRCLTPRTPD